MTELVLSNGDIAVATLRTPSMLDMLASRYPPSQLLVLRLDVTQPEEIVKAFAQAHEAFGRVDVVFNNAGFGVCGEIESTTEKSARALFDVNFWGAANVSREAVRFFREVNKPVGGRLLQVGSCCGIEGLIMLGYYSATKHALEGFTEVLAAELDPAWNIKITIVEAGWFRTEIMGERMVRTIPHPAYCEPNSKTADFRKYLEANPLVRGDTSLGMQVIYRLAALPDPPLHFPLGMDSVEAVRRKTARLISITDQFSSWSEGTEAKD
ncbi:hypothetical protein B0H21DRAFT_754359 [Amylocystis lapponica]|nr:hypothetical protein B0H21DRAFT_754359 [Amylocystis lapponica]